MEGNFVVGEQMCVYESEEKIKEGLTETVLLSFKSVKFIFPFEFFVNCQH